MEVVDVEEEGAEQKVEWLRHSFVSEWPIIEAALEGLSPCTSDADLIRIQLILGKYQEQPQLLDQHMEVFMRTLTSEVIAVMEQSNAEEHSTSMLFLLHCMSLIYVMSKVRGYKALLKYFPHEVERVSILERLCAFFRDEKRLSDLYLTKEARNKEAVTDRDFNTCLSSTRTGAVHKFADQLVFESVPWHGEYVTTLWLSVAILIPFHLSVVDTSDTLDHDNTAKGLGFRIRTWCQDGFAFACQEGSPTTLSASLLIARLLSRPDLIDEIPAFLAWSTTMLLGTPIKEGGGDERLPTSSVTSVQKVRVMLGLAAVLKRVPREALLQHSPALSSLVDAVTPLASGGAKQRRAALKVLGRLALVYLQPKPAQYWHYKKETRSLLDNLRGERAENDSNDGGVEEEEEEEEDEIDEEAEEVAEAVIGSLVTAICDPDTQVRFCSARQLSYIALRLPRDFAEQVVDMVLALFSPAQDDGAWHGASLALAEMGRRGLLLPSKLHRAIDGVLEALQYDEKHGRTSKGAHVRDAACYVAWAFARAFDPKCMEENIAKIAEGLVVLGLLDREVNCRRAAAAALQEHVGRQGGPMCENLPNAIDVITLADYFSLGSRRNAYVVVAPQVAAFPQYLAPIVDHLVARKVNHWDRQVRYLAAEALGRLTDVNVLYFIETALPQLLTRVFSPDTDERHGCILAVGEIVMGVYRAGAELPDEVRSSILDVIPILDGKRLFRGRGAEQVRDSTCNLIYCISKAGLVLKGHPIPDSGRAPMAKKPKSLMILLQSLLDENLKHSNEEIQFSAIRALRAFSSRYHNVTKSSAPVLRRWVAGYEKGVEKELNVVVRRGCAYALGALQPSVLEQELDTVLPCLLNATKVPQRKELKTDAETRRNAVEALLEVVLKVPPQVLGRDRIHSVFRAMVKTLNDYSFDRRGDVGSWVRASAMLCLGQLTAYLVRCDALSHSETESRDEHLGERELVGDRESHSEGKGKVESLKDQALDSGASEEQRQGEVNGKSRKVKGKQLLFTEKMAKLLVCVLLKQAVEKIDRVRDIACLVLTYILRLGENEYILDPKRTTLSSFIEQQQKQGVRYLPFSSKETRLEKERERDLERATPSVPYVPHRDALEEALALGSRAASSARSAFFLLVPLLRFSLFRHHIFSGITSSVGGLSKAINDASYSALLSHVRQQEASEEKALALALAEVGKSFRSNETLMLPFFKTAARLLSDRCFMMQQPPDCTFSVTLAHLVRAEVRATKDVLKLECSVPLLVGLLAFSAPTRKLSLECLLSLLAHRFPKVRKFAAEQLYLACLSYDDLVPCSAAESVQSILIETSWDHEELDSVRAKVNRILALLGLEVKITTSDANEDDQNEEM